MYNRTQYNKEYYAKNRERELNRVNKRREKGRLFVFDYKCNNACVRCGFSHPAALDFHHKDAKDKYIGVADAVGNGWSIERLKTEIDKCILLCANCHRIEHYIEYAGTAQ